MHKALSQQTAPHVGYSSSPCPQTSSLSTLNRWRAPTLQAPCQDVLGPHLCDLSSLSHRTRCPPTDAAGCWAPTQRGGGQHPPKNCAAPKTAECPRACTRACTGRLFNKRLHQKRPHCTSAACKTSAKKAGRPEQPLYKLGAIAEEGLTGQKVAGLVTGRGPPTCGSQ